MLLRDSSVQRSSEIGVKQASEKEHRFLKGCWRSRDAQVYGSQCTGAGVAEADQDR